MDPNQLTVILGLLTNGLYSLILFAGKEVKDQVCIQEDIYEHLAKNEAVFAAIIEGGFQGIPPVIKPEDFCEFLNSSEELEIIKRIYSFDLCDYKNLNNLEKVEEDFCRQLALYFSERQEISIIASQLFSILIKCCLESLDMIVKEEKDISALNHNLKLYIKVLDGKQSKYQEQILEEIKSTKILLRRFLEIEQKNDVPYQQTPHLINMAPDLETGFIKRKEEYKQLVEGLLNNRSDIIVAITTALRGAGGYGKTTLAKAVCHNPKIKDRFPDGILWITLGENPKNLIGHIQDLIYRLSDKRPEFEGIDAAISYFRDLLQEKRLLLVIDDVWDSSHLEPFMQGGPKCVRLITTRINEILPEGALGVRVDTMKNKEAVKLLRTGFPCTDDRALDELAKKLGYWPLLLKIVNSALKQYVSRGKSFEESLGYVKNKLERKKLTAFDPEKVQKRNQAVEATISVSLDLLNEEEFERYKELAIFPEDEEINLKVVEKLWSKKAGYNDFDVEEVCYKLFNLSLLQTYNEDKKIIKLHDVMREYLTNKLQQQIQLIHSQFLEAYELKTWVNLPEEETYLWKNLSYHLVEAGRKAELRELLLDFNWIKSKLNATDVHFLINDYDCFPEDDPVEMVKGAIQLSANALSKDKKLLAGQLLGRLELFSEIEIELMLRHIRENKNVTRILPLTGSLTPPGGPLLRTLEGHLGSVNAISFISEDGEYAISASDDNTLRVWDLKTGKEIRTLTGHSGSVRAVSVTPDGNYAVSASRDKTLKVWDIKTGKETLTLMGHFGSVNDVSVTSDGKYAISTSDDETIKVWDIKTGTVIRTLTSYSNWIKAISVTSDGSFAISALWSNKIKVWNLRTGKEVRTLTGHSSFVNTVSITHDGKYIISGSDDRTIKVWDIKTGRDFRTLTGHSASVNAVSVTPDEDCIISASADTTLKVWNLKTGKEVRTLTGHSGSVNAVSVTPDGNYAISASRDNTIKVWDLKTKKKINALKGHTGSVNTVSVTSNGKYAVSGSSDSTLKIWDIKTGKEVHTLIGHSGSVNAVSVTPDRKYAVSASDDEKIKVWDIKMGTIIQTLSSYVDISSEASVTSNGKYAVSASDDEKIKVKDLKTGRKVLNLTSHLGSVNAVSITSDGNYAVSASKDNTLKVWDIKTGKEVYTLKGHSWWVYAVSVTIDGTYAVSASWDNTLKVWDLKTGKEVYTLTGHSSGIKAVSVTPDGKCAVSGSDDRTVKIWNLKTGNEVCTLKGHSSGIKAVSVTPDGNYVISASRDNTLKVWDIKTGKEVHTLIGHSGSVNAVSITSDENYIVSASNDSTLKIWDFKTGKEISAFIGDSAIISIIFSPDDATIVAGERSGRVHFLLFEKGGEH